MNDDDAGSSPPEAGDAPFLPPSASAGEPRSGAAGDPSSTDPGDIGAGDTDRPWRVQQTSSGPPTIPPAPTPPPAEPVEFDARAMVEAQKTFHVDAAYGDLPTASAASRAATEQLRREGRRKRRRDKVLRRFVAVLVLAGLVAAGWFGYQEYRSYQDDQDDQFDRGDVVDEGATGSPGHSSTA